MVSTTRREVCGIHLGVVELGTRSPSVYVDVLGKTRVYFTPREALKLADAIQEAALDAIVPDSYVG